MKSHSSFEKKLFELKYRELLEKMYSEFIGTYKNYNLEYHKKQIITYDNFVSYCMLNTIN